MQQHDHKSDQLEADRIHPFRIHRCLGAETDRSDNPAFNRVVVIGRTDQRRDLLLP